MTRHAFSLPVACLVFFLSGASALIFETVWFRVASSVLGSSVWSAAAVLMAFMTGLGLGNAALAFYGRRLTKPFQFYIGIEWVIAITGVCSVYVLPQLTPLLYPMMGEMESSASLHGVRFLVASLMLLAPAFAMGATLPVLQKALHAQDSSFTHSIGRLYGWNTVGAVAGTLVAEFLLVKWLGIKLTAWFAGGLNILAAVLVWQFFVPKQQQFSEEPKPAKGEKAGLLLLAPFLAGFLLLALEVIWFRYITLSQVGSSIVFAVMLAIVLSGLAIGGLIATKMDCQSEKLYRWLFRLPLLSALAVVVGYGIFEYITLKHPLVLYSNQYGFIWPALLLMLPTSVLSGLMFPLYGEWLYRKLGVNTEASGKLTLANTFGAALGSVVATFVLLPSLGIEKSLFALALLYLVLPLWVMLYSVSVRSKWAVAFLTASLALVVVIFPHGSLNRSLEPIAKLRYKGEELVHVKEELNATLQYFEAPYLGKAQYHRLATNSYSMSSTDFYSRRYMELFVYLPHVMHWQIEDVLQISYGVGNTAEAVVSLDAVKRYDVVDVSADILELSEIIHQSSGLYPLKDKRTTAHIEDGRFYLQTTDRQYDLITGEPPPPKMAGISNLYTQEYFALVKERLKPKGITSYWLPVHNLYDEDAKAIIKAFCNEFSDCSLWNGSALDFILIGSKGGIDKVYGSKLKTIWQSPLQSRLTAIGLEKPEQLGSLFLADNQELRRLTELVQPLTDNFPHRISPDFSDVFAHSPFYDKLLNIDRRKKAWRESEYIRSIFSKKIVQKADRYFKTEGMITAYKLNHLGYLKDYALNWDSVMLEMKRTQLSTVPLLWMGLNARKLEIIKTSGADQRNENDFMIEQAKALFAGRKLDEVVSILESLPYEQLTREAQQLLYVAKAVEAGGVSDSLLKQMKMAKIDAQFIQWLKHRLG